VPSSLWELIGSDVRREAEGFRRVSILRLAYMVLFNRSLHVLYVYRVFHWLYTRLSPRPWLWGLARIPFEVAYRLLTMAFCSLKGVEIPYEARIGRAFRLVHPFNIVVAPQTTIGDRCTVFNGVTFGVNHLDRSGFPVVGNDVVVYPGAKVVGNVRVGSTVIIGPNSVVVHDVESNSVAVGIPAARRRALASLDGIEWIGRRPQATTSKGNDG